MSYGANIPTLAAPESSTILSTIVNSVLNLTEPNLVEMSGIENSTTLPPMVSTIMSFTELTLSVDEPKLSVNTTRYVQPLYSIFVRIYIVYIFTCDNEFKISIFSSEKDGLSYVNLLDLMPLVILSVTLLILILMIFIFCYQCAGNLYSFKMIVPSNLWL